MTQQARQHPPLWVEPGDPLPDPTSVGPDSPWEGPATWPEGLIAAGNDLGAKRLIEAYSKGLFPWFSEGQPVLWWSPDPRMVLQTNNFKCRRSLTKAIRQMARSGRHRISLNEAFPAVMDACAEQRAGQDGTWITDSMKQAYCELHAAGAAHSVEIWRQNEPIQASIPAGPTDTTEELAGGLYGVSLGRMFFGESMFARERDASKIALASLVLLLQRQGMPVIDCQQNTSHLASLGAMEISRHDFLQQISCLVAQRPPDWSTMSIEFPTA
ncbi:MAG: leucyl/phenylalanyl-tRNA--protein transferase [Burkholderiaceae bacterium]